MNKPTIDADVRHRIERERAYQQSKWSPFGGNEPVHSVAEWLLIIQKLCEDSRMEWFSKGNSFALHEVRQIAATAIACLEQCGCPERVNNDTNRPF